MWFNYGLCETITEYSFSLYVFKRYAKRVGSLPTVLEKSGTGFVSDKTVKHPKPDVHNLKCVGGLGHSQQIIYCAARKRYGARNYTYVFPASRENEMRYGM